MPSEDLRLLGIAALKEGKTDEANFFFMQAYYNGMSEDSLAFYLIEVDRLLGDLESAFNINLSINTDDSSHLSMLILEQRRQILAELEEQIKQEDASSGRSGSMVFSLYGTSGYENEPLYRMDLPPYPFHDIIYPDTSLGFFGQGYMGLTWFFFIQGREFYMGTGVEARKFNITKTSGREAFSESDNHLEYEWNLGSSGLIENWDFMCGITRRKRSGIPKVYEVRFNTSHSATLGESKVEWALSSMFEMSRHFFKNAQYYLIFASEYPMGEKWSMDCSVVASIVKYEPIQYGHVAGLYYVDNTTSPYPAHYTDASFTDTVFWGNSIIRRKVDLTDNSLPDTGFFINVFPQDFAGLWPELSVNYNFNSRLKLVWNMQGQIKRFWKPYEYFSLSFRPEEEVGLDNLFLSKEDGNFYLHSYGNENSDVFSKKYLEFKKQRRIDFAATAELRLMYGTSRFGSWVFSSRGMRNWTALDEVLPILAVPKWNYEIRLSWYKNVILF